MNHIQQEVAHPDKRTAQQMRGMFKSSPAAAIHGPIWLYWYYASTNKRLQKMRESREKLTDDAAIRKQDWWIKICEGKQSLLRCKEVEARGRAHWFYRELEEYQVRVYDPSTVFLLQKEIHAFWCRRYALAANPRDVGIISFIPPEEPAHNEALRLDWQESTRKGFV